MLDVEHTLPRLRRSQRPKEVLELRPPLALRRPDRREPGVAVERTDDALANVDLRAVSEPAPTLADRRQAFSQRAREHAVQVADGHVVEQPTLAIGERHVRACPWAVARRTKPGHLLVGTKHVPAAQQGEEVVRVILQRRQLSLPWELPREDRRDGVRRGVVHRGRPRVPRGVARETSEVRVPDRVERPVRSHQRAHRELVEDDEHDRRAGRHGDVRAGRVVDGQRDRRDEAEQPDERQDERDREERAERTPAQVRDRRERGRHHRKEQGGAALGVEQSNQLQRYEEREAPDRDDVQRPGKRARQERDERLGGDDHQRRDDGEEQREHDHVPARRPTHHQELRVPLQHREHRLADSVRPQRGQMREPPPVRRQVHQSGDAWYSVRVREGSSTERMTSNRDRSTSSKSLRV